MAEGSSGFKAFLGGVASNAVWELLKGVGGTAIVSATVLALLRYLRHRPVDWWGVLVLSLASGVVVFLSLRKSRQHELTLSEEFDRKLAEQRTEILGQVPSFMVNGVPIAGPALAAKESPKHQLPADQKLKILSAVYESYQGKGVDVTETLQKLIANDTLSVMVGNDLFGDPAEGEDKRLKVSYSYGSSAVVKIERHQSNRMVLPEDSFLKEQAEKSHAQERLFSPLQRDALQLSSDLLQFLKRMGPPPAPKYTKDQIAQMSSDEMGLLVNAKDGDFSEACAYRIGDQRIFDLSPDSVYYDMKNRHTRMRPWYEKLRGAYALDLQSKVEKLHNRFAVESVSDGTLLLPVRDFNGIKHVQLIAAKLWELAFTLEEKKWQ